MLSNAQDNEQHRLGLLLTTLMFITVLIGFFLYSAGYLSGQSSMEVVNLGQESELRLLASSGHHYRAAGRINGVEVTFLVDTGATGVAVNEKIAEKAGMSCHGDVTMSTANGDIDACLSNIDALRIESLQIDNVYALVMPNMDDDVLLGMSVLSRFDWRQENGVLIITIPTNTR